MDRVATLSLQDTTSSRGKRARMQKRGGSGTKVPRTDSGSDGSLMDVCTHTPDSAQSNYRPPAAAAVAAATAAPAPTTHAPAAAPAPSAAPAPAGPGATARRGGDCRAQPDAVGDALVASEECEFSGSEVEEPVADKYIKGTRLIVGGWFQACRGCNEPTAHTSDIASRDVPLCPRCQAKYHGMVSGEYPQNVGAVDASIEPLSYWLPRVLGSMPRMAPEARREFCDRLVLRQDDAWLALIRSS